MALFYLNVLLIFKLIFFFSFPIQILRLFSNSTSTSTSTSVSTRCTIYIMIFVTYSLTQFLFPQFQQKCFLLIETCSWIGLTVIRHKCYTHTHTQTKEKTKTKKNIRSPTLCLTYYLVLSFSPSFSLCTTLSQLFYCYTVYTTYFAVFSLEWELSPPLFCVYRTI